MLATEYTFCKETKNNDEKFKGLRLNATSVVTGQKTRSLMKGERTSVLAVGKHSKGRSVQ